MTKEEQLVIEEYKALQSEVRSSVDESVRLEIYAIGAIGGFYSWFLSHEHSPLLAFIPVFFTLFGHWRSNALLRRVEHISTYIKERIEVPPHFGWEKYFNDTRKSSEITPTVQWFWRLLLLGTSLIAAYFVFGWFCQPCCCSCFHCTR